MLVIEQIRRDWLEARKARRPIEATLLGTLVGGITTKEKTFNPARTLTEAEVIAEVKKLLDGVIETGKLLAKAFDRDDDIAKNAIEAGVMCRYLPTQLSEAEIEAFVVERKTEGLDMGKIMSALKTAHGGAYDGKVASTIVKRVLAAGSFK